MTEVIILAAGQGKRMGGDKPKVMVELNGRPFIDYVVSAVEQSGLGVKPIVVVSLTGQTITDFLADRVRTVVQTEQRGTGHAVQAALPLLNPETTSVVILYGDHPFIQPATLQRLAALQQASTAPLAMATVIVPDFTGWRQSFEHFGRIVRNDNGIITKIVEYKDATNDERVITELNPAFFAFAAPWLRQNIERLQPTNAQNEYYLTDLVAMAMNEAHQLPTIQIPPEEALGINTPEQLQHAEDLLRQPTSP